MNNREREMWVSNSEPLYKWWKSTKLSMRGFLKQHRQRVDHYIAAFLTREPNRPDLGGSIEH